MTNADAPQDKPTSWTPATNPIGAEQLAKQPPPMKSITWLPESRLVRVGIEVSPPNKDDLPRFRLWFEVDTDGESYVFKSDEPFWTIEGATRGLTNWLASFRFGGDR